jgi:hypothetical protein
MGFPNQACSGSECRRVLYLSLEKTVEEWRRAQSPLKNERDDGQGLSRSKQPPAIAELESDKASSVSKFAICEGFRAPYAAKLLPALFQVAHPMDKAPKSHIWLPSRPLGTFSVSYLHPGWPI